MLTELNTAGWEKAFDQEFIRHIRITRDDVKQILYISSPNHETEDGCEIFCSDGYKLLCELGGGWFAFLAVNCDGTASREDSFIMSSRLESLVSQLAPIDRHEMGMATEEDKAISDYSDA